MLRKLEHGIDACVTVTLIDGTVRARSASHPSMNYHSVVAFGTTRKLVEEVAKTEASIRYARDPPKDDTTDYALPMTLELHAATFYRSGQTFLPSLTNSSSYRFVD